MINRVVCPSSAEVRTAIASVCLRTRRSCFASRACTVSYAREGASVRHPNPPDQTASWGACTPELDIVVCGNPRRRVIRLDGAVDLATMAQFSAVLDHVLDEGVGETAADTLD